MNEKKHMEPLPANLGSTIQLYLDGEIGTDAFAKLEALIKNNSAARSFYRCYANMDANLREISEEEQGAEVVVPMPANRRRLVGSLLQAVATFILGASVVYLTVGRGKASDTMTNVGPPLPKAASPFAPGVVKNGLAILTQAVGVEWAEGSEVHAAITGLAAETLKVKKGLLQVEFSSGAIVIIEGPAEFELINSMQAYCHRGKIRTIVPEAASGFMIGSNGIDVVGLGTEFALDFDGSAIGEVHVFDGEVEVHEKPGGKMHNLMAGNGLRIDGGVAEFLPLNEMGYVDAQRVAFLANAEADEHLANWLIYSEKLKAHADVLLYYSFDEKTTWSRKLRNVRKMTADPLHGAIVGCSWSEGRWDGKGSLEFKRAGDRVRIQIPGSHDEFSLMAWVRIDGFDRELNSLMLSDNWVPGGVHWQFTRDGALILGTLPVRAGSQPIPPRPLDPTGSVV